MILVLLDTNAYLRLAKRIRPMLGKPFGSKDYVLTILKDVEDEVHRNSRLKFHNPWFDEADLVAERLAKQVRLSKEEHRKIEIAQSVLHGTVRADVSRYCKDGDPPSPVDCYVLAFGQIRPAIVVTDDLGMHLLAGDFGIKVWHGYDLLKMLHSHKMVDSALVREIYSAMEENRDMTRTWSDAKHAVFAKIFGKAPG